MKRVSLCQKQFKGQLILHNYRNEISLLKDIIKVHYLIYEMKYVGCSHNCNEFLNGNCVLGI